jgi:hypothetical protein
MIRRAAVTLAVALLVAWGVSNLTGGSSSRQGSGAAQDEALRRISRVSNYAHCGPGPLTLEEQLPNTTLVSDGQEDEDGMGALLLIALGEVLKPVRHGGRRDGRRAEGARRAATTDGFPGAPGTQSFVTVLTESEGRLVTTGMVGDLGRGERIYALCFQGPVGYVVTFRQTDPLYTLDLANPARPLAVGELKINGYSAYLHAFGDGLLLGIGQDATNTGQRLGAQVSLFDMSDPAQPRGLAQRHRQDLHPPGHRRPDRCGRAAGPGSDLGGVAARLRRVLGDPRRGVDRAGLVDVEPVLHLPGLRRGDRRESHGRGPETETDEIFAEAAPG